MHGQIEQQKQRKAEGESQGSNTDLQNPTQNAR